MQNLEGLAREWIAGQANGGVGTPAWQERKDIMLEVLALPEQEPDRAWAFILEVLAQRPPEEVLGLLSACLLEDLLTTHGLAFIERIEEQARVSSAFKHLLGQVWLDSEDTPVWRKVYDIAGLSPPFPDGWRSNPSFKRTSDGAA